MKYYRLKVYKPLRKPWSHHEILLKDLDKFLKNQGLPRLFNELNLINMLNEHEATMARIQFGNEIILEEYEDETLST